METSVAKKIPLSKENAERRIEKIEREKETKCRERPDSWTEYLREPTTDEAEKKRK